MERKEENNLFKYATKELSQDAFICWCINWINYKNEVKGDKNKEKLYEMSEKILEKILENTDVNSFDIEKVNIIRQFENIDITLVIKTKGIEYIVIIEDKVGGKLNQKQQNDLYVSKLTNALKNNKEKQEILGLSNYNEKNIIPVYWKTNKWDEDKEKLKKDLDKNTKRDVVCIDGYDTLKLLKSYVGCSEIIENFYYCLYENLKINNQIPEDENYVDNIIKKEKIVEGTTFTKNYYVYNCFTTLTGSQYNAKSHTQKGGIPLTNLSKRLIDEKILNKSNKLAKKNNGKIIVSIDAIRFFNCTGKYKNKLYDNKKLWVEEVDEEIVKTKGIYTNLRYVILFAKELDAFRKEKYVFLGLYRLFRYEEDKRLRLWEKQELPKNEIVLNEDKLINLIKKFEK